MTYKSGIRLVGILAILLLTSAQVLAKSDLIAEYGFTASDKESYLTVEEIVFVRPGLELEIMDVVIPDDLQTEVTFKITDPAGLPLDRDGLYTPGAVSTSFILSFIPEGEKAYVAYTTRIQTSPDTGESAEQATSDSDGTYTMVEDGVYTYKFGTVLPSDYDVNATHTLGIYARRDLREFDLDRYVSNELEHFVPSGAGEAVERSIVTTETCNSCHDPLAIHGGSRQEVGLCILCHNPTQSIDPDTMDSVNMPYMVHKIHAGAHLEHGYTIVGHRQSVHDYSEIEFTAPLADCEVCHTGGTPTDEMPMILDPNPAAACNGDGRANTTVIWADKGDIEIRYGAPDGQLFTTRKREGSEETGGWVHDNSVFFMVAADTGETLAEQGVDVTLFGCATNPPGVYNGETARDHTVWMTDPNRMACGSCHDDVDFESGENHQGIVQEDDTACGICHKPATGVEYDRSVAGAHTVTYKSNQLPGFMVEVLEIGDTGPGQKPWVEFKLHSKWGPMSEQHVSIINRLRFAIAGPNDDFDFYVQEEDVEDSMTYRNQVWRYEFEAALPEDADGSYSFGAEGRLDWTVNEGQDNEFTTRDQMQNYIEAFTVTDSEPMERRMVVDDAKCESCHSNLSLHGSNRHDANGYCQTCHNPSLTDEDERPEGSGEPESADFRYMIHKIHRGADLENPYVVYGHNGSLNDFSNIHYVGDLRNCDACHVDGSYKLPLAEGALPVTTPRDLWSPMMPETASCVSCHDSDGAKQHAAANTSEFGEACSVCHGEGKTYSVEAVHAR